MIAKRLGIIAVLLISFSLLGCVKNPGTGENELDFPAIAEITGITSKNLSFELLKHLHENEPGEVAQVYAEFATGISIIQRYSDGDVTAGETALNVVEIFQRLQARFDIADSPVTAFVTSTIAAISGALNVVLIAVPEDASMILTAVGNGLNDGLENYTAYASADQTTGVVP